MPREKCSTNEIFNHLFRFLLKNDRRFVLNCYSKIDKNIFEFEKDL